MGFFIYVKQHILTIECIGYIIVMKIYLYERVDMLVAFYNEIAKQKFMGSLSESYRKVHENLFNHTFEYEDFMERDLYTFSFDQVEKVMFKFDSLTFNSARTYGIIISNYMDWAFDNGYRQKENPLMDIDKNWYHSLAKNETEDFGYISVSKLEEIEDKLVNYQDKICLRLLFEGLSGAKLSEVVNLKRSDVNKHTRMLKLTNDNGETRELKVSKRCIEFISMASEEEIYMTKNGNGEGIKGQIQLVDTDYVLKLVSSGTTKSDKADQHLIFRRLSTVEDIFEREGDFRPKRIRNSGMIYHSLERFKKDKNIVTDENLENVAQHFNMSKVKNNKKLVYNFALLREIINEDTIRSVYPGMFQVNWLA